MAERLWALVPASGVGSRMKADCPKQYLTIKSRFLIDITCSRLLEVPDISGVMVVLSVGDQYWPKTDASDHSQVFTSLGGAERFNSVLNGLYDLRAMASEDDWVMVHDAARPCVRVSDVEKLIAVAKVSCGALLGVPAKDTIKQVRGSTNTEVELTVERSRIWQAFTPQMFRIGQLIAALEDAINAGSCVTDDASAMELAGFNPRMVEGATDNIKVTQPQDLLLAEWLLDQQCFEQ